MKIAVLLLFMAQIASAQSTLDRVTIPFPSELAGPGNVRRDGNSVKLGVFAGSRLQQVYSAGQIRVSAPQGGWIDTIGFRADRSWKGDVNGLTKGYQILMGTTSTEPGLLKSEFRQNVDRDLVEVRSSGFSSMLSIASDGRQPTGPILFLTLERPYFYSPDQGNLIFDITPTSGFLLPLDYHTNGKGEFGSVFADFGSAGYPNSGEVSAGGFVTFVSMLSVPEPSVVGLAALGGAALLAASRQRKSNP